MQPYREASPIDKIIEKEGKPSIYVKMLLNPNLTTVAGIILSFLFAVSIIIGFALLLHYNLFITALMYLGYFLLVIIGLIFAIAVFYATFLSLKRVFIDSILNRAIKSGLDTVSVAKLKTIEAMLDNDMELCKRKWDITREILKREKSE